VCTLSFPSATSGVNLRLNSEPGQDLLTISKMQSADKAMSGYLGAYCPVPCMVTCTHRPPLSAIFDRLMLRCGLHGDEAARRASMISHERYETI